MATTNASLGRGDLQRGIQLFVILLFYGVLLFLSAGRLDWLAAWGYLAIYIGTVVINMTIILPKSRNLSPNADGKARYQRLGSSNHKHRWAIYDYRIDRHTISDTPVLFSMNQLD